MTCAFYSNLIKVEIVHLLKHNLNFRQNLIINVKKNPLHFMANLALISDCRMKILVTLSNTFFDWKSWFKFKNKLFYDYFDADKNNIQFFYKLHFMYQIFSELWCINWKHWSIFIHKWKLKFDVFWKKGLSFFSNKTELKHKKIILLDSRRHSFTFFL